MRAGFSLVELAIVLVIIGLITGGILMGQDLIRASELNSVVTDLNKYKTAVNTFRLKYNAYPGDMANATLYWGRADGGSPASSNCAAPNTNVTVPTATCNGNGDGNIAFGSLANSESYRAWQHLSLSGLVPGNFTGVGVLPNTTGWYTGVIGTNIPASKLANVGYSFVNSQLSGHCGPGIQWTAGTKFNVWQNHMYVAAASTDGLAWGAALVPAEAASIDSKIDDGLPGRGNINAYCAATCTTGTTTDTATYNLSSTSVSCGLLFNYMGQ